VARAGRQRVGRDGDAYAPGQERRDRTRSRERTARAPGFVHFIATHVPHRIASIVVARTRAQTVALPHRSAAGEPIFQCLRPAPGSMVAQARRIELLQPARVPTAAGRGTKEDPPVPGG
jgi:hypothetical protein